MTKILSILTIPLFSLYMTSVKPIINNNVRPVNNQWKVCTSYGTGESSQYGVFEARINYAKNLTTGVTSTILKTVTPKSTKYIAKNLSVRGAYPTYLVSYDVYEGSKFRFSGTIYVNINENTDCSIHWMSGGMKPWSTAPVVIINKE